MPDCVVGKKVVGLVFASNRKPASMEWIRDQFRPFYQTVNGSEMGGIFECILVCPDEDAGDYNATRTAAGIPALAQGDPMIKNLVMFHKVQDVPWMSVVAEDATEIAPQGVLEMNPPPPTGG